MVVAAAGGKEEEEGCGGGVRWGTWEELVLGGAVLRHGAAAWDTVAAELRARSPCSFSPEECEAKFSEIQTRYSACDAWFDELRKQRVAELKRELRKSDNFIGSLQSMIESLSNSKHDDGNSECHTSHTESCPHAENTANTNSSSKELSKDKSSAASFTEEASTSQKSQVVQHCATDSIEMKNISAETQLKPKVEKKVCAKDGLLWGSRKKRGLRDKRIILMAGDSSIDGDNTSTSCIQKDGSPKDCMKDLTILKVESGVSVCEKAKPNLTEILKIISNQGDCSMLQQQVDIQRKRARYKKMIRRHMDFRILHSKIKSGTISSTKDLLKDMLLFVNNVLTFYAKATLEHMAAIELRHVVCKMLQQSSSILSKSCGATGITSSPVIKKITQTLPPARHVPRDAKRSKVSSEDAASTVSQSMVKDLPGDGAPTADEKTICRIAPAAKKKCQGVVKDLPGDAAPTANEKTICRSAPAAKKKCQGVVKDLPGDAAPTGNEKTICRSAPAAKKKGQGVVKDLPGDAAPTANEKTICRSASAAKKKGQGVVKDLPGDATPAANEKNICRIASAAKKKGQGAVKDLPGGAAPPADEKKILRSELAAKKRGQGVVKDLPGDAAPAADEKKILRSEPAAKKRGQGVVKDLPGDAAPAADEKKILRSKPGAKKRGQGVVKDLPGDAAPTADGKNILTSAPAAKKGGDGRPPKSGEKRLAMQQDSPSKAMKKSRRSRLLAPSIGKAQTAVYMM